jgi:hypothetical protein
MPNYSSECKPVAEDVKGLKKQRLSFQKELRKAAPGEKAFLIEQIDKLNSQITQQEEKLKACVKEHPSHT